MTTTSSTAAVRRSFRVQCSVCFMPEFRMRNRPESVKKALGRLEFEYGIAVCEDEPYDYDYQWSYPNTWPPVVYLAIRGLDAYGYRQDARRIAEKYAAMVVKTFGETHNLWEKYNVREGNINVSNEYDMPTMLGWSAGTFIYASDYLDGKIDNQTKH